MKQFSVKVKIYNNLLKERREKLGYSQVEIAKLIGLSQADYCAFEGMRKSPFRKKTGLPTRAAEKIALFFNEEVTDLWPESVLAVKQSSSEKKFDAVELLSLSSPEIRKTLMIEAECENTYLNKSRVDAIMLHMEKLTEREKKVVRMHFGMDGDGPMTFEQIGKTEGCCSARSQQILQKALRKIRGWIWYKEKEEKRKEAMGDQSFLEWEKRNTIENYNRWCEEHPTKQKGVETIIDASCTVIPQFNVGDF